MNKLFFTLFTLFVLFLPASQQAQTPLDVTSGTKGSFDDTGMYRMGQMDGVFLYLRQNAASLGHWEIWRSDGSKQGTFLLKSIGSQTVDFNDFTYSIQGAYCYYSLYDFWESSTTIWRIDKNATASKLATLKSNGPARNLTLVGQQLYYSFYSLDSRDFVLQRLDTQSLLKEDIEHFSTYFAPVNGMVAFKTGILLVAGPTKTNPDGGLYQVETSSKAVKQIKALPTTASSPFAKADFLVNGDKAYFFARTEDKYAFFVTDGSTAGTIKLLNVYFFRTDSPSLFSKRAMVAYKDKVLFSALGEAGVGRDELYVSNGTLVGTKTLRIADYPANPQYFTWYKDELYFNGYVGFEAFGIGKINADASRALLVLDGKQQGAGPTSFGGQQLSTYKDSLVFVANRTQYGSELWLSNGSNAGTRCLDIEKGTASSNPRELEVLDNKLFFAASTQATGYELFLLGAPVSTPLREPLSAQPLRVFPNPVQDQATIEAPSSIERWQLLDINGRVLERGIPESALLQVNIPTAHLPAGTYFLQAWSKSAGQMYRATLVKP